MLVISKEASPRDPRATSHRPGGPLVLRRGVYLSAPIINHTTRTVTGEMRTNRNALLKTKNPVTNAGVDKAASRWSGLLPRSAAWCWVGGSTGAGGGRTREEKEEKGGAALPINCARGGTPPRSPGAEVSRAHTAPAPQSRRSPGGTRPCLRACRQGSAADWRPPACRTRPWAR